MLEHELQLAIMLARAAGEVILDVYRSAFSVEQKSGSAGPVTQADLRANALLVEGLRTAFPDDAIVSEEAPVQEGRSGDRCWFVDPLDGTAEFVDRNGMFAVQIGLCIQQSPVLGVVYAPEPDVLYAGIVGQGAFLERRGQREPLPVMHMPDPANLRMAVSRSHRAPMLDEVGKALHVRQLVEHGSVGLKCGLLLTGAAELYVHASARSYRWDSCGPEAIIRAAGGVLTGLDGMPYQYRHLGEANDRGMICCHPALLTQILPTIQQAGRRGGLLN